jgi:hypothetical protein
VFSCRNLCAIAWVLCVASACCVKADEIYLEGQNNDFGLLNPQTGSYTLIGVTSVRIGGMGFAANGNLYGIDGNGILYRIDPATARAYPTIMISTRSIYSQR